MTTWLQFRAACAVLPPSEAKEREKRFRKLVRQQARAELAADEAKRDKELLMKITIQEASRALT